MPIRIAVLKEQSHERRVAMVPGVVDRLIKLGAEVLMQSDPQRLAGDTDIVLAVEPPAPAVAGAMKEGAILVYRRVARPVSDPLLYFRL